MSVMPEKETEFNLYLRIPGWASEEPVPGDTYKYLNSIDTKISLTLNGKPLNYTIQKGYAVIRRKWRKGDVVELNLPMPVRKIIAIDSVKDNRNRVALQRGPLVYCFEHNDNDGSVMNILVPDNSIFKTEFKPDMLNGVVIIKGKAPVISATSDGLSVVSNMKTITGIPYFSWANRGQGQMQVWMPRKITDHLVIE
jgi:DUF1680 family protein